jgi:activator of 2-hydroxyglutaryl-CoA dehydratase
VIAHNPYLITMIRKIVNSEIVVPEHPQLTGAVGAALFAMELDGQ